LQNLGISPDASILGYLPSYWAKHPSIGQITFRHLMSHRSGLDVTAANGAALGLSGGVSGQSVATLRTLIAAGIQNGNLLAEGENAPYINANFALLRVLVPRMTYGEAYLTGFMDPAKSNEDAVYSAFFAQLASAYVLQPTGMVPTNCAPRETLENQTLYYSILNNNVGDLRNHAIGGNFQRICGATGFYLSAVELAGVLAYQRHSNAIIGNAMRSEMNNSFLGWMNPATFENTITGDFGTYRAHGGDSASNGATAGMAGCMMDFPIQVQAVLLINSRGGPGGAASCSLLRNAYDGAWTYP
jgi:CubicO group peptidase (beta-lactamase class C family)